MFWVGRRARHAAELARAGAAPSPTVSQPAGVDVTIIGLASTDELYCASGLLGLPGAMFTASHNPAQYNGIKLCRAYAAPSVKSPALPQINELRRSPASRVAGRSTGCDHRTRHAR